MRNKTMQAHFPPRTLGDAAVDGLIFGLAAGLVMALFLLAAGVLGGEAANDVLGRFGPAQSSHAVSGLLAHLAVSAIYGVFFGLLAAALLRIRPSFGRLVPLLGLLYGLALFALSQSALYAGVESGFVHFTTLTMILAHVVYGLVLGVLVDRKWQGMSA